VSRLLKFIVVLAFVAYPTSVFANLPLLGAGGPGIPVGGCAQASTYLARTTGGNEGGNAANMTTLICGLVRDGVITGNMSTTGCGTGSFDAFYIEAQQNQADALLNLCGTNFTQTGSASFTSFEGFSDFNSSTVLFISTNFNSTTATSPNYTQSSASFGFWSVNLAVEAVPQMGTGGTGASGTSNIFDDFTGGVFHARVNNPNDTGITPTPGTKGLFVAERPTSGGTTTVIPYWDGIAQTTQTATSEGPLNANFVIGNVSGGSAIGSSQIIAEAFVAGALGPSLHLALFNRLRTYNTGVGIP
jgi:hypothetical protein